MSWLFQFRYILAEIFTLLKKLSLHYKGSDQQYICRGFLRVVTISASKFLRLFLPGLFEKILVFLSLLVK
jgi:hypothetical protein